MPSLVRSPANQQRQRAAGAVPPAPLRIAILAPPWLPVPPHGYGGIESVIDVLCDGLVRRGHDVTLFAAPGSRSIACVQQILPSLHGDEIGRALYESDHVARVFAMLDGARTSGDPYDLVHDHSGFVALAMADRLATPMLHTLHGPFEAQTTPFYEQHSAKASMVAISRAQAATAPPGLIIDAVVPNPIDVRQWPFQSEKHNYLLWLGRMHESKGPHRAIAAARKAGLPLVLAGPIQPGQEAYFRAEIAGHLDGEQVRYVGEVAGQQKMALISRARALLMPIQWHEPFGMVMIEALVCGTPVIAFPEGAAPEIVRHGVTGFLVADEAEMAAASAHVPSLDARAGRADVARRFDVDVVCASYEAAYHRCAGQPRRRTPHEVTSAGAVPAARVGLAVSAR